MGGARAMLGVAASSGFTPPDITTSASVDAGAAAARAEGAPPGDVAPDADVGTVEPEAEDAAAALAANPPGPEEGAAAAATDAL